MAECLPSMRRPWVQLPAPQNKFKKQVIFKILSNAYIFLKTLSFILKPYALASCTLVKQCILHLGVIEEITYHDKCCIYILRVLKTWRVVSSSILVEMESSWGEKSVLGKNSMWKDVILRNCLTGL